MMANPDSDQLWFEFLNSLKDEELIYNEEEEEVNDPEYSISEELLQISSDWDFTGKVTEYELDLLLDEEDYEMEVQSVETAVNQNNSTHGLDLFDEQTVKIMVTQFSQHIQLLTQTYFQSLHMNGLESVAQNVKSMLEEINNYSDTKTKSIFSAINIKPAIDLIGRYSSENVCKTTQPMTSWRTLPVTEENQRIFISNPNVFIYSWLLPNCGYYDKSVDKNKCKNLFNHSEDHLIALGLEEFKPLFSLRKCYRYIKQLLLPNRSVDQIRTHIKNIKKRHNYKSETMSKKTKRDVGINPIMYYTLNGRAPETHPGIIDPKLDTYLYYKSVPEWYKKAMRIKEGIPDHFKGFSSKAKKFKSIPNVSQIEKKKSVIVPQQSPVKQTNSIVKKYKYLNRLNPSKQCLSFRTNASKTKLSQNVPISTQMEIIDISDENYVSNESQNQKSKLDEDIKTVQVLNECLQEKTRTPDEINDIKTKSEEFVKKILNENLVTEEELDFDDESDLAALMTASSTITTKNKNKFRSVNDLNNTSIMSLNHNKKEGRKSSAVKQRETTLQLLSFECNESDPNSQQKEELLIQNYLEKVKKSLTPEEFVRFLTLLSDFYQKRNEEQLVTKRSLIRDLYFRIEEFFKQTNVSKDIINEFVLFLSAEEAEECGKMFDYLYWKRFFNFIRKLEIYSANDSQCLHRLFRSLNQLKQNEETVDKNKIRSTVSRVLNGQSYLMHEFSSLILDEKPNKYLFEDQDFDEVVIDSSDDEERTDICDKICFETINIPESDEELKYGTNECPCRSCHTGPNHSLARHCTSCSIRFIGGRVYLTQNHKKLGLTRIQFTECDNNSIKQNEDINEEDIESDNEIEFESNKVLEKSCEKRIWTLSDDKMLLELCRSKVVEDKHNHLSEEVFEEVAQKLSKDTNEVIARFNRLMELFASEQDIQQMNAESHQ